MCRLSWNLGASTSWNPLGLLWPVMGLIYLFILQQGMRHLFSWTISIAREHLRPAMFLVQTHTAPRYISNFTIYSTTLRYLTTFHVSFFRQTLPHSFRILLLTLKHVSTETGLRAGPYGVRIPWTQESSLLSKSSRSALGPNNFLSNGYRRSFWGVRQAGRETDHPPPPSAQVKNEWSYTSAPPIRLHDGEMTFALF